jgi:hypothetical protein
MDEIKRWESVQSILSKAAREGWNSLKLQIIKERFFSLNEHEVKRFIAVCKGGYKIPANVSK